jgi:hypothetical protein
MGIFMFVFAIAQMLRMKRHRNFVSEGKLDVQQIDVPIQGVPENRKRTIPAARRESLDNRRQSADPRRASVELTAVSKNKHLLKEHARKAQPNEEKRVSNAPRNSLA